MTFRRVASLDGLWSGEMRGVAVDGRRVLLVNLEDHVHAYEDRCVHQGVPLSEGRLQGHLVKCRAHEWEYDARAGRGVNPANAQLRTFATRIEGGEILVDVTQVLAERVGPGGAERVGSGAEREEPPAEARPDDWECVGPVLQAGPLADAVRAAILDLNGRARIVDRGAYVRVLVPGRCVVRREAVERRTGRPFRLPVDLEPIMPSFKGALTVTEDEAVWSAGEAARK
jgi:toluene monooxygenase system ferredoxin subunit